MEPLVSTIELARPPAEVFTFTTDPHRFAEWQHDVVSVRMLGQSRFATTRRIGGAERTMIQQITRNDPPVGWAAQGIDGPIRAHATITVEPVDDATQSQVTFTLDFEGHGLGVPPGPAGAPAGAEGRPEQLPEPQKPPGERAVAKGGIRHCVEHCDLLLRMAPSKSDS